MKCTNSWAAMLYYGIPSYRLPRERLKEDIDTILSTGVEVHLESPVGDGGGLRVHDKAAGAV